jgi:starch synthase
MALSHCKVYRGSSGYSADISTGGSGLNFTHAGADDAVHAIKRALHIYSQKDLMKGLIYSNMSFDFSWEKSAKKYLEMYNY